MIRCDYLIIGAGVAGIGAVEGIRLHDKKGSIVLIGNEPHLPYHRPKLLDSVLAAKKPASIESLAVQKAAWVEKNKVDYRCGSILTQFNLDRRAAVLDSGLAIEFQKTCIATGCRSRRPQMAGGNLGNVFYLRAARDILALREAASDAKEIVVCGGGLLGAETAVALSNLPKVKVSLLHRGRGIWNRWLDEASSAWLTKDLESNGIKMLMNEHLHGFEGRTILTNVQTKSGQRFPASLAVAALGVEPNIGLFANTPLSSPNGVPVGVALEAEEKGIFAAGDVALWPDCVYGGMRRVEHHDAAYEMGRTAGENMTGKKRIRWDWLPRHRCTLFDNTFEFIGDLTRPGTRLECDGDRRKGKFTIRAYISHALMGVVLCNPTPAQANAAAEEIRAVPRAVKKPD